MSEEGSNIRACLKPLSHSALKDCFRVDDRLRQTRISLAIRYESDKPSYTVITTYWTVDLACRKPASTPSHPAGEMHDNYTLER